MLNVYEIIYKKLLVNHYNKKFKILTATETCCLKCGKPIYVSFQQIKETNIFCEEHKNESWSRTNYDKKDQQILFTRFMQNIKNKQLQIIEDSLSRFEKTIFNNNNDDRTT